MLALEGVSKTFRTGPDVVDALQRVDLNLNDGDVVTIIGSNGAGKSTLLHLISGTVPPTSGRVMLDGRDITALPAHRRSRWISWITQNPLAGTAPSMTVVENLALAATRGVRTLRLALRRRRRQELRGRLESLGVGLENRLDCRVSLLSGGERQALAVLMATLATPRVLLLDEHTAALDPHNADTITALSCDFIRASRLTALWVTHNMAQALEVGNRLVMMHRGEIVCELSEKEKEAATVEQLVQLFAKHRVADDELLLGVAEHRC